MKRKNFFMLVLALCCALTLFGCAEKAPAEDGAQETQSEQDILQDEWGLTLALEFTEEGGKLTFTRSGGAPSGELQTGSYYVIEQLTDGAWESVPYREDFGEDLAWTMEAYLLPVGETTFDVDWSFLYGELSPGTYRIGKEVMDFRAPGDYDEKMYYAEFAVID